MRTALDIIATVLLGIVVAFGALIVVAFNNLFKVAIVICLIIITYSVAWGQDVRVVNQGAIICDTREQLQQLLDSLDSKGLFNKQVEGCGHLTRPHPAMVEEHEPYHTEYWEVKLVKLTFPTLGEQWGYIGWKPRGTSL